VALDPRLLLPSRTDDLRETDGVIAIRLVGHHVQRGIGVAGVDADDGQPSGLELVPEQTASGPVSMPSFSSVSFCLSSQAKMASGQVETLPSARTTPGASTIQIAVCSCDTSSAAK
jgi:hypothetical protein